MQTRETLAAALFIAPNFLGFLTFTFLPVIASLVLSFFKWDLITSPEFVGFSNFTNLFGFHENSEGVLVANNSDFWYYARNTLILMLGIPLNIFFSLLLAMWMNRAIKGIKIYRAVFFLPTITSGIALYVLWRWIYNPDFGLMNIMLQEYVYPVWNTIVAFPFRAIFGSDLLVAVHGPQWLNSVTWAKPALIIMGLWIAAGGYNMILYLAALQNIPEHLYEAARIDGAGKLKQFRFITLPMLRPTTFFIVTMSIIGGLQGGFDQAYVMTGGGPAGATTTIGYYIYQNAYQWQYMGTAAAIAWFLFIIVMTITLINWKYGGQES